MIAISMAAAVALAQAGAGVPVLALEQALAEARRQNLDLQQAEARLLQAKQLSWKAWSGYLPQVGAGATFTRNELEASLPIPQSYPVRQFSGPTSSPVLPPQAAQGCPSAGCGDPTIYATVPSDYQNIVIQKRDQLQAQIQVNQALIVPQLWPAISNAYKGERVAELNTENARREILFGVAQVYYGAASARKAVEVVERQLAIAREHEKDARIRYQAGTTSKVALLRAEIDRAQVEQDLKRAQNAQASAKLALATLLDHRGDFEVEIPPPPKPPVDPNPEETALRDRPDVLAAGESLRLAEGSRTGVYTRYLPSLGAFGRLQWANVEGFTGKRTTWALGLNLTWNVFDGGLREADLRESQAKVAEAEAARRSAENRAVQEVRQAQLDLDSALANKAKASERVELAREEQKLVEINYKAGAATYIEVTDANESLRSAELGLVNEGLNADLATLRLLKAVGVFREQYRQPTGQP
jgi:outer membrane protein TolC